MGKQHHRDTT